MSTSESGGYFMTPPAAGAKIDYTSNKVYGVGSTAFVQWYTSMSQVTLVLWQQDTSSGAVEHATLYSNMITNTTGPNSFNWTVSISYPEGTFDTTPSVGRPGNVFFFSVTGADTNMGYFTSHYFNITNNHSTSSSMASTATTITSSTQSSSFDLEPTATSPDFAPTASPDGSSMSSKLGPDQQAGIGVGVGLACLLIITALVGLLFLRKKRRESQQPPPNVPSALSEEKMPHPVSGLTELKAKKYITHSHELPGHEAAQKLSPAMHVAAQELP